MQQWLSIVYFLSSLLEYNLHKIRALCFIYCHISKSQPGTWHSKLIQAFYSPYLFQKYLHLTRFHCFCIYSPKYFFTAIPKKENQKFGQQSHSSSESLGSVLPPNSLTHGLNMVNLSPDILHQISEEEKAREYETAKEKFTRVYSPYSI